MAVGEASRRRTVARNRGWIARLCRVHEALRITPAMAMAIGITNHLWTIGELVDEALAEPTEQQAA